MATEGFWRQTSDNKLAAAGWPTLVSGTPSRYVDAFSTLAEAPGEKFSWVDPDMDPPTRDGSKAAWRPRFT